MKKVVIALFILLLIKTHSNLQAQPGVSPCGTTEWMNYYQSISGNNETDDFIKKINTNRPKKQRSRSGVDTIPVVVHVVWNNASENIPDSVVIRQIDILNADFRRLNADTVNTPLPFQSLAGASPFYFCLATRDPNGAFTTGIVRRQTTHGIFLQSSWRDVIRTSDGGDDIWPQDYLNIYCGDLDNTLLGIAQHNFTYCMVDYTAFGLNSSTQLGRVATHEVGHSLGLQHPWGNEPVGGPYNCSSDDYMNDTPVQYQPSGGCPTFPYFDSCTPAGDGIMFVNYMDYSFGSCKNMFTAEQVAAMSDTVANFIPTLLTSTGCDPLKPVDAGVSFVFSPTGSSCATLQPYAQFRNWGLNNLTSVNINYILDGAAPVSIPWTGNLSNYEPDSVILPALTTTSGWHIIKVYTSNPNGVSDQDNSNDTIIRSFNVSTTLNIPYYDGFDSFTTPTGWIIYDHDYDGTFMHSSSVHQSGAGCFYIYNEDDIEEVGHFDDLTTKFNLSAAAHPFFSFYVAYSYSPLWGGSDTLEVLVSGDCGLTYDMVYKKFDSTLITAPILPFTMHWSPTSSQWRKDSIDLTSYIGLSNDVIIRIRNINDFGPELYIDEVRVDDLPLNVGDIDLRNVALIPSPNTGNFQLTSNLKSPALVNIFNSTGQKIYSEKLNDPSNHLFNLNLANGIYLMSVNDGKNNFNLKFIVD